MKINRVLPSELPSDELESLTKDSFFASPGFLGLWKVRGGVPVYWAVWQDDTLAAVLPGVEFGRGPLKRLYATPNGCYGKLCVASGVDVDFRREAARGLMKALSEYGYMKLFVSDFYNCLESGDSARFDWCETRLVDVSDPDWSPPHRKVRQDIARAEREGVVLERFDDARHFEGFLKLERMSLRRTGARRKYQTGFFRALAELSRYDDRVRWIYSQREGKPMASSIFIVEGDNLLYWHVYFDESFSHFQATKYIIFKTVQDAAKRGVRNLNMGGSPEYVASVHDFKERWGGEVYRYRCFYAKSWLGRMI